MYLHCLYLTGEYILINNATGNKTNLTVLKVGDNTNCMVLKIGDNTNLTL